MEKVSIKKAFTLLELIFVIVILGIVSSIGSSIIAQVFDSYITQRSVHDASLKTELAINQLTNRLTYRMNNSLIARKPGTVGHVNGTDYFSARNVPLDKRTTFSALEWIGYDSDSFEAQTNPGWSGYCDLNTSNFAAIDSVGSTLSITDAIKNYYAGNGNGAIRFMTNNYDNNNSKVYDTQCMYGGTNGCMFPVTLNAPQQLTFTDTGDRTAGEMVYSEFYQYATSAFAVVPENKTQINGLDVYDLNFYYGYQPWENENYNRGKRSTLLTNVSVFRFRKEENSIRLKICVIERISDTDQISICKEKAVIR